MLYLWWKTMHIIIVLILSLILLIMILSSPAKEGNWKRVKGNDGVIVEIEVGNCPKCGGRNINARLTFRNTRDLTCNSCGENWMESPPIPDGWSLF